MTGYRVYAFDASGNMLWLNGADTDSVMHRDFTDAGDALNFMGSKLGRKAYAYDCDNYRWTRRTVARVHIHSVFSNGIHPTPEVFTV